jgi:hypothetical protein
MELTDYKNYLLAVISDYTPWQARGFAQALQNVKSADDAYLMARMAVSNPYSFAGTREKRYEFIPRYMDGKYYITKYWVDSEGEHFDTMYAIPTPVGPIFSIPEYMEEEIGGRGRLSTLYNMMEDNDLFHNIH